MTQKNIPGSKDHLDLCTPKHDLLAGSDAMKSHKVLLVLLGILTTAPQRHNPVCCVLMRTAGEEHTCQSKRVLGGRSILLTKAVVPMDLDIPEAVSCLYRGTEDASSFASAHKRCSLFPTSATHWGFLTRKSEGHEPSHGQRLGKYSWLQLCHSTSQLHDETGDELSYQEAGGFYFHTALPLYRSNSNPHWLKQSA